MKKLLLSGIAILSFCFLFAQIPNADMELWDNQPVLLQWETNSRPLTLPPWNPYIVVKDTDRYSGNFSANLIGNGMFHSLATTTFAIAQHPSSLSLFYKLSFAPCVNDSGYIEQDTVSVRVEILDNGNVVDAGYWEFSGGSNWLWSQLTIPVSNNSSQFDSCRITITGGRVFGGCGFVAAATEFKVDHLSLNYHLSCANTGVIVQGVECWLIDTLGASLLMPCNIGLQALGFNLGDTINFSFIGNNCISFCMQGTGVDLTCIDTGSVQPACNVSVALQKQNPTSFIANNGWLKANVTGGALPVYYAWSNGVNGTGMDSIGNLGEGSYCVTISDANSCTATACDSLAGAHICIDSALICEPGGLCCDAPLFDPVCGCDSVTYTNPCIATMWGGVTGYYMGACVTTGIKNISETETGISVSPVPAKDKLNVIYLLRHSGNTEIKITNLLGQTSKTVLCGWEASGTYQVQLPVNDLLRGIYFVEVKNEFERKLKRFVIE